MNKFPVTVRVRNDKVALIKMVRDFSAGMGLREAKIFVEDRIMAPRTTHRPHEEITLEFMCTDSMLGKAIRLLASREQVHRSWELKDVGSPSTVLDFTGSN